MSELHLPLGAVMGNLFCFIYGLVLTASCICKREGVKVSEVTSSALSIVTHCSLYNLYLFMLSGSVRRHADTELLYEA